VTCASGTTPTKVLNISSLDAVSNYQFAIFAKNDIGTGPTTDAGSYVVKTTYGASAAPARPTLV
jgi:hypothetical protein